MPLAATLGICWREPNKGFSFEDDKQASRRADVDLPNIGTSEVCTPYELELECETRPQKELLRLHSRF